MPRIKVLLLACAFAVIGAGALSCGSAQLSTSPDPLIEPARAQALEPSAAAAPALAQSAPDSSGAEEFLAAAGFELSLPTGLRQGDPFFISVALVGQASPPGSAAVAALGLSLRLRYANGELSPPAPVVAPLPPPRRAPSRGGRHVEGAGPSASLESRRDVAPLLGFATLGIATSAPVGEAVAALMRGDRVLAERGFDISSRQFRDEAIKLDKSLTSLRADPDPMKTEQAERYLRLLAQVDPNAVFLNDSFVRPLAGNRRTSLFGDRRRYQYYGGGIALSEHAGIDYGYPVGTPIAAAGRGRVVMAEDRIVTGLTVVIEHLPGVYTIYMHLSRIDLSVGDLVERLAPIGLLGATGLATGPHLHWELRVLGVACDPEAWIGIDKVPYIRTINPTIEGR